MLIHTHFMHLFLVVSIYFSGSDILRSRFGLTLIKKVGDTVVLECAFDPERRSPSPASTGGARGGPLCSVRPEPPERPLVPTIDPPGGGFHHPLSFSGTFICAYK